MTTITLKELQIRQAVDHIKAADKVLELWDADASVDAALEHLACAMSELDRYFANFDTDDDYREPVDMPKVPSKSLEFAKQGV